MRERVGREPNEKSEGKAERQELINHNSVTKELLSSGHLWDEIKCPVLRGIVITGVNLY